jgi:hypothetical protein
MRKFSIALLMSAPLCVNAATNLVTNGSFESGLTGWAVTGAIGDIYPPSVIDYNSASAYPAGAFGESVPVDSATNLSPDAAGNKALYLVSDFSSQTITQVVTIPTAGSYAFGLDVYLPANGFANAVDGTLGIKVGSSDLGTYTLSSFSATTWTPGATVLNLAAGETSLSLAYTTHGFPAKDIVIDKVYLISSAVPEAGSVSMMLAGLAAVGLVAARRRPAL